jgi:F420 biosynthesis protein FbiB-like protein
VRRYAVQPVPADLVDKLLDAAHWAPSAHNRQPWRFVLLNDLALRRRLAESMAASWQADLLADGADAAVVSRRAAISIERITRAPLAILPCLDLDSLDRYPDPQRQQREWQMGVQSVALACQNLLLAAQQHGLVACWMCAPIFCPDLVQAILDLPPALEPQALLTIGYPPDDAPRSKERAPLATRVVVR